MALKIPADLVWAHNDLIFRVPQDGHNWLACVQKTWPPGYDGKEAIWAWRLPNRSFVWSPAVRTKAAAQVAALTLYLKKQAIHMNKVRVLEAYKAWTEFKAAFIRIPEDVCEEIEELMEAENNGEKSPGEVIEGAFKEWMEGGRA